MGLLAKGVVVDRALPCCGLQPRPGPHVPTEAEVAFKVESRLLCLFVGRVGICGGKRRRQLAEALLEVAVERGSLHMGDIRQCTCLLGVRTQEERNVVLLS
jgi:hypothetical protein